MIHDLAGLFEEVPVKVLVETKAKSKLSVFQHKSHPNDTVTGGLVTSGIQANSSSHTFFRGGEGTTIKVQSPNANKNAVTEQSLRMGSMSMAVQIRHLGEQARRPWGRGLDFFRVRLISGPHFQTFVAIHRL